MDWRRYWEQRPTRYSEADFAGQVGRTCQGRNTGEAELALVVAEAASTLELKRSDCTLDLCCGNGLLTQRIREMCDVAVGVDFSEAMIHLARRYHQGPGIAYLQASALELSLELFHEWPRFSKVVLFESFQYFRPDEVRKVLSGIRAVSVEGVQVLFTGVLDAACVWLFYDTPERRAEYLRAKAEDRDIMGTWWDRGELKGVCAGAGFDCQFIEQNPSLNTAHYRFDLLLKPVDVGRR